MTKKDVVGRLKWEIEKDPETGLLIASCEQLSIGAHGLNVLDLNFEINQVIGDFLDYLDENYEGGIAQYFRDQGIVL